MDAAFIQDRITSTKKQIIAFENAITAFADNGAIQTYKLDTGQTIQTVTRADLNYLQQTLDTLYNRCATLEARVNGASTVVRPGY